MPERGLNELFRFSIGGQDYVLKVYRPKPLTEKSVKYWALGLLGAKSPVEYQPCDARCEFERLCYLLWREDGYRVPTVYQCSAELGPGTVALCLEYVEGESLDTFLCSPDHSPERKLEVLSGIFAENARRHSRAIEEREPLLVHYDGNLRNVILAPEGPVHVDFEMGRPGEDVVRSIGREVKKLCIQAANALGPQQLPALCSCLASWYGESVILERIVAEALERPFMRYHMVRDRRRKQSHPGLLTKIDFALALREAMRA